MLWGRPLGVEAATFAVVMVAAVFIVSLVITVRAVLLTRRAEQSRAALAVSQERLAEAQRIGNMGSWQWDVRTNELVWSDQVYRIFGVDRTFEPAYQNYLNLVHSEDRESLTRAIGVSLSMRAPYQVRHRIVRPDGEVRTLNARGEVVFSPSGEPVKMFGVCQDVTELARLQEEADEGRRRLEHAQRIANVGSWEWEFASGKLTWSQHCYRIVGWDPADGAPTIERFLASVHPDDRALTEAVIGAGVKDGAVADFDHRVVWPSGEVRVLHQLGEVRRDANGRPAKMVGTTQDVTELRAARAELVEAKLRAEAANHAKSQFVANMSHELRTPLNAIIGFSEILRNDDIALSDERRREYAQDIYNSGKHLLAVINDILDISRIEAGKVALVDEALALGELIDTAARMVRPRAEENGVTVTCGGSLGTVQLVADRRLMLQALLNLASNAVKFTERGGRVDIRADVTASGGIAIAVSDTGIGMSAEDVARVGEPFLQIDGRLARKFEGTGLGLVISKRLIELHSGTLNIESELGRGTTMTISLPASRTAGERGGLLVAAAS